MPLTVGRLARTVVELLKTDNFRSRRNSLLSIGSMSGWSLPSYSCAFHNAGKRNGQIQLILGPMFSGKSTELVRRIRRFQIADNKCLVIKYAKDSRYSVDDLSTHDKQMIPAVNATNLKDVHTNNFSVIGVDEGQFFGDVVEFCETMANQGKIVIVAALDGTFERKPFRSILDLVPLAESVVKLTAVCNICHREAAFTKRKGNETEVEIIGGTDMYMAVCRRCYHGMPVTPQKRPLAEVTNTENCAQKNLDFGVSPKKPLIKA